MAGETSTTESRIPNPEPQLHPQISIIVPAYNAEKYITKCLDSLINQDVPERNYEIIITDDGSTDGTGKICDKYVEQYFFIYVTHTEHRGLSHARNVALSQCKGEYLTFCDADDYVSPQLISVLNRAIEILGHPDIISYCHYTSNNIPAEGFPTYNVKDMKKSDAEISDGEELCIRILKDNKVGGFTWNKLIRTEIAQACFFDESLRVATDHKWLLRLFIHRRNATVFFINYFLYCYVHIPNVGQTRDVKRVYGEGGMRNIILTFEKELILENLSPKIKRIIEGNIYFSSIVTLFSNEVNFSREVRSKLKFYIRNYAFTFYFRTSISLTQKVKAFIAHCLLLLHIHKPRRK